MQSVSGIVELRAVLKAWRLAGYSIAFVPTMGNLHAGHMRLVEVARQRADKVVVSIFVNPSQFGVGEDFDNYPRTEREDQEKLKAAGADLVFLPQVAEIYVPGAQTIVSVTELSKIYCGAFRPTHFNGVTTIVCKLFNCVQPDIAVFGLKDFQQLAIIRIMVRDLSIPVEIIGVETAREQSGLAMSSRNNYLSAEEKLIAAKLYESLCNARDTVLLGKKSIAAIEQQAVEFLQAAGFKIDYFSVCRSSDLQKAQDQDLELVILAAVRLGKTRLIDNICFEK